MELNQRILLVEDEEHLQEALKLNLELENYTVVAVGDGKQAIKVFREGRFNLVLLDVMLPEMDGFRVCETIRLEDQVTPILFLTARDSSEDRVKGLKKGGDDYLTKPFNLEELLLRVRILLKRHMKVEEKVEIDSFQFGGNEINFALYEGVNFKGEKLKLTKKEVRLLKLLIERKNEVVSREEILESVWGYDIYPTTRTIDNFILAFRKYFEQNPKEPQYFQSIRGVGYQFSNEN